MLERFLGPVLVPRRYSRYLLVGCALGVAAILVVLSLFTNYFRAVEIQLLGIHPHISVEPSEERLMSAEEKRLLRAASADLEGLVVARPAIDRVMRLRIGSVETFPVVCIGPAGSASCFDPASTVSGGDAHGATGFALNKAKSVRVRLRGIDATVDRPTIELDRVLDVKGEGLDLARLAKGPAEKMPMAAYFERRLFHGASPLDDFLLVSAPTTPTGTNGNHHERDTHHLRLLSTLHLGLRQDTHPVLVTSIANATSLSGMDQANVFEIRLEEPRDAPSVAAILADRLGELELDIRTWLERDEGALRLLGVLRWVILLVASSVMVVAALGVVSTLSLVVMEGRRKIAMLRAMGLRDRNIYGALGLESLRIATLGLATGVVLGALASWTLLRIPGFQQGLGKMGVDDPRVMLQSGDLVMVALATWALFLIVAWWPAREACRIHPVAGLQG